MYVEFFLYYIDLLYKLAVWEEFFELCSRLFFGIEVVDDQALRFFIALSLNKHHFLDIKEVRLTVGKVRLADDWFEFAVLFVFWRFLLGLIDVNTVG